MNKNKITILLLGCVGILIAGFGFYDIAEAADSSVYISPASLSKEVGDTFDISVKVNPAGEKVCVVEGKLILNKLSCQKVTMGSDISSQTSPSCDDLNFLLGIQGCTTSNKTLFTVTVKAKNAGTGTANFTEVDIIGEGVSISFISSGGTYTLTVLEEAVLESEEEIIIEEETEKGIGEQEEEEEIKEEKPETSIKKEEFVSTKKLPRISLLASLGMAVGEISKSTLFTIVTILCLIGLVVIGAREWYLFQKKRKK